jgi:hypothetical protein
MPRKPRQHRSAPYKATDLDALEWERGVHHFRRRDDKEPLSSFRTYR